MKLSANDAGMERIRAALPRYRPFAVNAGATMAAPGYDARVEAALLDRLLGPTLPGSGRSDRAPVVGVFGAPGGVLRSVQSRPATAMSVSPRGERAGGLPAMAAGAGGSPPPPAAAPAPAGAPVGASRSAEGSGGALPALSGAGGGLVGVLAARVNELEAELAAKARDGAARERELASLRRQLEGALAEVRKLREAAATAAAAAEAAATAPPPRAPSPPPQRREETPPRPTSAIIFPAPRSVGSPSPIRVPASPGGADVAAALRGELASARRERADAQAAAARLGSELQEIKTFLGEYGLVWVGKEGEDAPPPPPPLPAAAGGAGIDFAFLHFRLTQLNSLAGEGKSRVVAKGGAHQLTTDAPGGRLLLTLFSDGLMLRRGPFRPYSSASCKAFVQDILDGFFPFELKGSYPQGVAFEVVNRTGESYESPAHRSGSVPRSEGGGSGGAGGGGAFQGEAHSLKGGSHPPTAAAAPTTTAGRALGDMRGLSLAAAGEPLFSLPAHPLRPPPISAGALLAALPERAVSAAGAVVEVRGAVGAALGLAGAAPAAAPVVAAAFAALSAGDPAAAHVKVRFDGAPGATRVFLLHADGDTVGTLLAAVAAQRADTGPFELRSAALPRCAFTLRASKEELQASLRAAGLAPTASLFVRPLPP